ncbi:polyamine ABC transporter substrate-binding protein [Geminicoccaceae bacterium SYSU G07066]|uniref:Putrescine-binding periplasmic protein n=1 Tax=Benzoatithermus flavus TaxID=3108223 RepID=A0ABU8XSD3_9PROT
MRTTIRLAAAVAALLTAATLAHAQDKVVRIYNWSDYIDESILEDFTKETGIKVVYDVYDSNEVLETKLLAGNTGYDLVVPSGNFLGRQIQAGVFQKLDKSRIPNWKNLDPKLMAEAAKYDPGNEHAFIYMWGTTGIAYNVDKIKERMPDAPVDSWKLVFDPAIVAKFKDCGIMMLDAADDLIPIALNYIGEDPDTKDPKVIAKGAAVLEKVRPFVRKFHSSENINALANGDICISVMYSGDAGIAATRAEEAKNGVSIEYRIPKEGALLWFDMMAMPKDAPDPENAYAFMNYLLQPEVIAKSSNAVTYPNAVPASYALIDEEVRNNPNLFPPEELKKKLFVVTPYDQKVQRAVTRMWTKITTGG